jgi:zinc transport system substrate-binding protein
MNKITLSALALLLSLTGCSKQDAEQQKATEKALTVYTTIAPLHYVCEQLLGDQDQVIETCPIGEDEPEYIPAADVLVAMVDSDTIFINGASFENWLNAVSLPETLIHDTASIYQDEWLEYQGVAHSHGGQDDHSHNGYNGHTWTSPHYFQLQCQSVYEKLQTLLTPEEQQARNLDANYQQLTDKLSKLNEQCKQAFAPVKGTTLAASHPTFDYLGKSCGFEVINLDIAPDIEEINEQVQTQIDLLQQQKKENGLSLLFWEEQPNDFIGNTLSKLGFVHIVYHPLAGMDDPDYITGMMKNFERVTAAIEKAGK